MNLYTLHTNIMSGISKSLKYTLNESATEPYVYVSFEDHDDYQEIYSIYYTERDKNVGWQDDIFNFYEYEPSDRSALYLIAFPADEFPFYKNIIDEIKSDNKYPERLLDLIDNDEINNYIIKECEGGYDLWSEYQEYLEENQLTESDIDYKTWLINEFTK